MITEIIGVEPTLVPAGRGIFDVEVDDTMVYSKYETGTFPDPEALTAQIQSLTTP